MTTAGAVVTTVAIYLGTGFLLDALVMARAKPRPVLDELVSILALGYVGLGAAVLITGYLHLFYRGAFIVLGIISVAYLVAVRARVSRLAAPLLSGLASRAREAPLLSVGAVTTLALAAASGVRFPLNPDEHDYKWATPLLYAFAHRFIDLPFRLSNGVFLGHLVVMPSATFATLPGARLVQLLAVVLLAVATLCTARRLGGSGWVAGFGALSCFIVPIHAREIGTDLLVAALLMSALALMLSPTNLPRSRVVAGVTLAAAVSTKSYSIVLVPVFVLVACLVHPGEEPLVQRRVPSRALLQAIVLPVLAVMALTVVHTLAISGRPFKETLPHLGIYASGSREVRFGQAAGRIPSWKDLAIMPFTPFSIGLHGTPFGTRPGIFFAVALPIVLVGALTAPRWWRTRIVLIGCIAAASYLLLDPIWSNSRFLLFVWLCVFAGADVVVASWHATWSHRTFRLASFGVQIALLMAFGDAIRLMTQKLTA